MTELELKKKALTKELQALGSVAVAFSSGVDSTFLLKAAVDALGTEHVIAVTAKSCSFPQRELHEAEQFCKDNHIRQVICESEELAIEGFRQNPPNRCYLCKRELFARIWDIAREYEMNAVVEGSNTDDDGDYRPGLIAVKELGVQSPLRKANLSKKEIRELSKELGLPTWDKQSFACLSSRFVYGETISEEKLGMVDRAEQYLIDKGFHQLRVRIHGNEKDYIARIEVEASEFARLLDETLRADIYAYFKQVGFAYITLDLLGYRTGSMNETLEEKK